MGSRSLDVHGIDARLSPRRLHTSADKLSTFLIRVILYSTSTFVHVAENWTLKASYKHSSHCASHNQHLSFVSFTMPPKTTR